MTFFPYYYHPNHLLEKNSRYHTPFICQRNVSYLKNEIFFIDPQTYARITDFELRKVFIEVQKEEMNLDNLNLESLHISPELREHLQWRDAQVRRVYEIFILDRNGQPVKDITIMIDGESFVTDDDGRAEFTQEFDEKNYGEPILIEIYKEGKTATFHVDYFTETPIRITEN